jgi:glucokinase
MKTKLSIGVDVGGSHVSCAAIDLTTKQYLDQTYAEQDLDNHASAGTILGIWGETIRQAMVSAGIENIAGIGFAMPGPFDYQQGISLFTGRNDKFEQTYGLNVPETLRQYLGLPESLRIRFINDATAFAIGEDRLGKAAGTSASLSVTLGTGFGSAFIRDGLPVLTGDSVPEQGCLWHLPFEDGIADDYFSTRGLLGRFREKTGRSLQGVKQLADLASTDQTARLIFDDFGLKLGQFLDPWIRKLSLEMLVLGGNISRAYPLFETALRGYLESRKIPMEVAVSELKENASIIGSATLVEESFYERVMPLLQYM